jgi:UDP-N-acetylmuramate-alanine ligase
VAAVARPGDIVLVMGAGDIWKIGEEIVRRLETEGLSACGHAQAGR